MGLIISGIDIAEIAFMKLTIGGMATSGFVARMDGAGGLAPLAIQWKLHGMTAGAFMYGLLVVPKIRFHLGMGAF